MMLSDTRRALLQLHNNAIYVGLSSHLMQNILLRQEHSNSLYEEYTVMRDARSTMSSAYILQRAGPRQTVGCSKSIQNLQLRGNVRGTTIAALHSRALSTDDII